ncbi:MAG: Do family serine endopeptidase [Xanthobacteraceae bacterium]
MNQLDKPADQLDRLPPKRGGLLSARRVLLLATTVLGLGAAALVFEPTFAPEAFLSSPAQAQNLSEQTQNIAKPVGFADIVQKVKPAVISVRVKIDGGPQTSGLSDDDLPFPPGSPLDRFFRQFGDRLPRGARPQGRGVITGQGSGFFISADGYAVTNNHVVDKADQVQVTTDDGKTYTAKVIGTDPKSDLALIKVEGGSFPYVKLADSQPRIGDWVLAVGNPFGLGGTVTAGIVSARGRDIGAGPYDDFIQIDAPVNKGNSGGPTFDVDGNVIGVNTAIFSPSGGSVGIAFAIPAETVKTVIAQLKDHGSVNRGWIGVQIQPVTQDIADSLGLKKTDGALVSEPQTGSPAAKAGIESGDVITSLNGEPVKDARDLAKKIGSMAPGTAVKLSVIHQGAEKTVTLTLGQLPATRESRAEERDLPGSDVGKLGLTLAPATGGGPGVVITNIDPNGIAADQGFQPGDVILTVDGKTVGAPADVRKAVDDARKGGKRVVLMRVKSSDGTKFVALPISRA